MDRVLYLAEMMGQEGVAIRMYLYCKDVILASNHLTKVTLLNACMKSFCKGNFAYTEMWVTKNFKITLFPFDTKRKDA